MKKMILFRIGWMDKYDGVDTIEGGGSHVETHGVGGEMWNFRPEGGRCFGYVMTRNFAGLNLDRIGLNESKYQKDDEIDNVDIVFISKNPSGGQVVVGWFKNATIFHKQYRQRHGGKSVDDWEYIDYVSECSEKNATLLKKSERNFIIPKGKGFPGQSNVWYADSAESKNLVDDLRAYIKRYDANNGKRGPSPKPLPKDIITLIEKAAVDKTIRYYEGKGYEVKSVEADNVGWDLEASNDQHKLLIEVKGHRGNAIHFGLTPNEYENLKLHLNFYRVAVVRNALLEPDLVVFTPYKTDEAFCLKSESSNETVFLRESIAARAVPANS
ncbi:protein NO VEIN domain-containing protein [Vibrio cholerae]|uniref:protein NO VEIN domain-containing protein n=1 Tax=Vibrio cholerae TaxID=666 RepID=UPI000B491347|nr:DUF3883 domain-containing protein [Vibrio cholerae]MCX9593273.1 DUF3883 domain-containing protein [Vibrio cholerae]MDV2401776.1 DUF3883 domain-containing protein [Vibrio cholerae]MUH70937.1 DUF3883 domain-containing protein [Vibrio cholerae]QBJ30708.1 DUF3883 domain-containing protein [Vibrio cholerae]TYW27583.1 DUF3883 domain-containing protein [Vibrio cholerae]